MHIPSTGVRGRARVRHAGRSGAVVGTAMGAVAGLAPAWTASRREIVQGFRTA